MLVQEWNQLLPGIQGLFCCKRSGYVNQVDASRIVISAIKKSDNDTGVDIYRLSKFQRSNQDTCINQTPLGKRRRLCRKR